MLLVIPALLITPVARAETDGWESVAPGIDYQQFTLPGPNRVFVTRMDRANPNVTLESSIAHGKISGSREKVTEMAERYDQALNYWGQAWGARSQVVVAINGGFFNLGTGIIEGGQVQSGWYAKRFTDLEGRSGFAWKLDRSAFIGECVNHRPNKQYITYTNTGAIQWFYDINVDRGDNQLIVYTPQYDARTHTDDNGVEVLVQMSEPDLIQPAPHFDTGIVREIRDGQGGSFIPFDSIVLSASGAARNELLSKIHLGEEIHLSQEINHTSQDDCQTPVSGDWTKTYASIDGSVTLVKDGVIPSFSEDNPDPRTAIAFNGDRTSGYIYFIVVDGRIPGYSIGMSFDELAHFAKDTLGATWAINQDGGGSSTMVVNGVVKNHPSDRCKALFLPFISRSGGKTASQTPQAESVDLVSLLFACQRPVANGMLMVVVESASYSNAFTPGESVETAQTTVLRLGPGSNYAEVAVIPANMTGTVIPHSNNLNGILAKGSYWWQVSFDSVTGWMAEETLTHVGKISLAEGQ
jgi:hypothetical protein